MAIEHKDIADEQIHEPKHIQPAQTSDSGKVITPSSGTNGVSTLRFLSLSDLNESKAAGPSDVGKVPRINSAGNFVLELARASEVSYDNTTSGLASTDANGAIDEVEARVDGLEANAVINPQADIANLALVVSDPPTAAEVQQISDKVDAILGALRSAGVLV